MTRWLEIGWADIGIAETAGPGATPEILAYFRDCGRADVTSDEIAWCAAYTGACLARSGISLEVIPKADRLLARSYLALGTAIDEPRVGAIAVLTRPEAGPRAGHVGIISAWTATQIKLLSGNQSNSVNEQWFPRERLLGMRWPEPAPTAAELTARGSRTMTSAKALKKDALKIGAITGPATLALPSAADLAKLEQAAAKAASVKTTLTTLIDFALFAAGRWTWIAGGLAAYWGGRLLWHAGLIQKWRLEDAATGANSSRPLLEPAPQEAPL